MSTQDLVYNLPKLKTRPLQRKLTAQKLKTKRYLKAKIRRAKSQTVAAYRRQYFLTTAGRDFHTAASKNEDIFITSIIIATVIGYCFATTATDLLLLFFQTALNTTTTLGLGMLPLSIAAIGSLGILTVWVLAFMLNTISLALMDGMNGKQHRSIRTTLRQSLRQAGRISTVWVLLAIRLAIPACIAGAASIAYILGSGITDLDKALGYAPYAAVAAVLGMLYVLLQYSLAPYVTLFEQPGSYRKAFARSRQLVKRRGRLFLLATYLITALAAAGIYGLAVVTENLLSISKVVICALGALSITIVLNGILVVLYRKRKLARKH